MLLGEDVGPSSEADDLTTSLEVLAPDNERRFQRGRVEAPALHDYLVDELSRLFGNARPRIILCCGKCRVGSTPLANVFGHANITALYQPIKTLLRHGLVGEICPPMDLAGDEPIIFIKETYGPYVAAECTFSPIRILLDAGFRPQDIKLIVMERRPEATIRSWWRCWYDRIKQREPHGALLLGLVQRVSEPPLRPLIMASTLSIIFTRSQRSRILQFRDCSRRWDCTISSIWRF